MNTNSKKIGIIACILFIVIILCGYYFRLEKNTENSISIKNRAGNQIQQAKEIFIPYEERIWNMYTDDRYKYSIEFPSGLNVFSIYEQEIKVAENIGDESLMRNGGVGFSDPELDNYGVLSVSVFENTNFSSVDEWIRDKSKSFEHQSPVIEKKITIDGYEAVVTYVQSDYEREDAYKHEKTTLFIKDGNLFEIWTRFADSSNHETVWSSLKFNKK